jgi:hypothetical protein
VVSRLRGCAVLDLDREGLARDTDSRPRLTAHPVPVDGAEMAFTLRAVGRDGTEDMIRRELEAFLPGFETFPQYPVFRASGRRGLWQAMAKRGGPEGFVEEYGLPYTGHRCLSRVAGSWRSWQLASR